MKRTFTAAASTAAALVLALSAAAAPSLASRSGQPSREAPPLRVSEQAPSSAASAHGPQHTRLTLHVATCPHCPVRLVQAISGGSFWHTPMKRVDDGTVTFRVLTRHTHGMSFEIRPRWSSAGYIPNIVTRYGHTQPGDLVTNDVARHKGRATGCWSGTTARAVTLDVRAVKFPLRDMEGNPGHSVRAWFKPTLASTPPMVGTTKGAIGNQDAFYCKR